MRVVDLSGYMFSGKSAASDLLREFDGFHVPGRRVEFDLLRCPHGLLELKQSMDHWSPVRSDAALRRFIHLAKVFSRTPKAFWERLFCFGFSYDDKVPGFSRFTEEFVERITEANWQMRWPYECASQSPFQVLLLKLRYFFRLGQDWPLVNYRLCDPKEFMKAAQEYLEKILFTNVPEGAHSVLTHNMLEPFQPEASFDFFKDVKSIVVDRDVRDIFVTGSTYSEGFNDQVGMYSKIIGAFDIDVFIKRQKLMRSRASASSSRVLRLQFEDLITSYDQTLRQIMDFLELPVETHQKKGAFFNLESSKKNFQLWKRAPARLKDHILTLERECPELIYDK